MMLQILEVGYFKKIKKMSNWGKAAENNTIGFGQAASNATNGFGESQKTSWSGDTNIVGLLGIANNYSISFDGINDYIEIPFNLPSNTTNFSVSMWVNTTSFSTAQILIDNRDSDFDGYNCFIDSNTINFRINGTDTSVSTSSLNVNNWFHLALTYDGSTAKIYLNSGTPTEQALTTTLNINNVTRIGTISQSAASTFFNGSIDEVGIWNTALTSTEVQSIYNATSTNLTKDLTTVSGSNLVYWNRMGD